MRNKLTEKELGEYIDLILSSKKELTQKELIYIQKKAKLAIKLLLTLYQKRFIKIKDKNEKELYVKKIQHKLDTFQQLAELYISFIDLLLSKRDKRKNIEIFLCDNKDSKIILKPKNLLTLMVMLYPEYCEMLVKFFSELTGKKFTSGRFDIFVKDLEGSEFLKDIFNVNLRNSIAHLDFFIDDKTGTLKYHDKNKNPVKIEIKEFLLLFLRMDRSLYSLMIAVAYFLKKLK